MSKKVYIFGLRRSGNHAIIMWLKDRTQEHVHFHNNIRPYKDPGSKAPITFVSYEDADLSEYINESNARRILILRDPYNMMASRIRGEPVPSLRNLLPRTRGLAIKLWKQYAREALGETHYLHNKCTILYNKWFRSSNYRRKLCEQLGIKVDDSPFTSVPNFGGGSSFNGRSFDKKAFAMDVLNRYRKYLDDKSYVDLFDESIERLSNRLFGPMTPPRKLVVKENDLQVETKQPAEPVIQSKTPKIIRSDKHRLRLNKFRK